MSEWIGELGGSNCSYVLGNFGDLWWRWLDRYPGSTGVAVRVNATSMAADTDIVWLTHIKNLATLLWLDL